jgi:phage gp45-like
MNPAPTNRTLLHALIGGIRGGVSLGVVTSVNDSGGAQTVNLTTGDGVDRADVEVFLPFGFTSNPPLDGAICLVFAIGADPSNLGAIPIANPSARFGATLPGETVLYGGDGSRVAIRQGGVVEVWAGSTVAVHASGGTTFSGNVTVDGSLTTTGDVSDSHGSLDRLRGHYNGHDHAGGAPTSEPDPE